MHSKTVFHLALAICAGGAFPAAAQQVPCNPVYQTCSPLPDTLLPPEPAPTLPLPPG